MKLAKFFKLSKCKLCLLYLASFLCFNSFILGQAMRDTLTPVRHFKELLKQDTFMMFFISNNYYEMETIYCIFNLILTYMFGYAALAIIDTFG